MQPRCVLVVLVGGEEPEARLREGGAGWHVGIAVPREGEAVGVGGTLEAASRARCKTDVVVRRREHTAVEVCGAIAAALHERAPRRRQAVLAGSMSERDEEPGLGRHRVVDAELVDEAQALLDVPVGRSRVATKIGEHALHVFESAAREALTEPVGDRERRRRRAPPPGSCRPGRWPASHR